MRLLLLIALGGLMHTARSFQAGAGPGQVAMALGFLLLAGWLAGSLFASFRLPRLTGYLATGVVCGPHVLALVGEATLEQLQIFNGVAVALIAVSAGAELHLPSLRPLLRTIAWISLVAVVGTAVLLAGALLLVSPHLPFLAQHPPVRRAALCAVLGIALVAQSPAVVAALHREMRAEGPLSRTVLALVVLADLLVILLFGVASGLAKASFGASPRALEVAGRLAWELLGSLGAGLVLGALVALYLRQVRKGGALFVLGACFLLAEVGRRLHLDPLLAALALGLLVRNATSLGERLQAEIDASALPVYVAFFAVAGAGIHVGALELLGLHAAAIVAVRAAGLCGGAWLGARLSGAPPAVRAWAGTGLLPQAGLALALAYLLARTFPELGKEAAALVFSVVAINELAAPIVYRLALVRSSEAGARAPAPPQDAALPLAVGAPAAER